MTDKETLEPKKQEPVQLELFEEPGRDIKQEPVSEETLALFREKSDFLLTQSRNNPFNFSEVFLRDFIGFVLEKFLYPSGISRR